MIEIDSDILVDNQLTSILDPSSKLPPHSNRIAHIHNIEPRKQRQISDLAHQIFTAPSDPTSRRQSTPTTTSNKNDAQ
jgi:hypothetical protein